MYGGCDTCQHSWGETKCKGCLWDGKSQRNTHWEQKVLEEELDFIPPRRIVGKMISVDVLDKIKAELERRGGNDEKAFCKSLNESYKLGLREAIEIIDKYMAESEG